MIERTTYRPKPGRLADVLSTRARASAIRQKIGLPAGEIFVEEDAEGGPLVHWEARFATEAEQARDLAARGDSAEFTAVREEMRGLIDGFTRRVLRPAANPASRLRAVSLDGVAVVPEEVSFASGALALTGYLYLPPGPGPHPCMITNHGSGIHQGTTDICRPGTAAVLMSWGIASFLPHRRGYGNSPGTPWRGDVHSPYGSDEYDTQLARRLADESEDVVAALEMLETRPGIDPAHIGVMGSSFGGTVTLLAAAACPRFRCAVEFAGAAMNWERAPKLRDTMHAAAARLTQPIFFLQAANDYSIGPTLDLARGLEGSGKVVESRVYPGFGLTKDEGHALCGQGAALWGADVRRFLDRWL
jgi:dienelactone hydrolase